MCLSRPHFEAPTKVSRRVRKCSWKSQGKAASCVAYIFCWQLGEKCSHVLNKKKHVVCVLPGARPWQGAGTKQVAGVISEEEWRGTGGGHLSSFPLLLTHPLSVPQKRLFPHERVSLQRHTAKLPSDAPGSLRCLERRGGARCPRSGLGDRGPVGTGL